MSRTDLSADEPSRLGIWLRELRDGRREALREVAAAVEMDQAVLSKIENGQRSPTEEQAEKLAKHFGVNLAEMQLRWLKEKMFQEFGKYPQAREAMVILADELGKYRADEKEEA